MQRGLVAALDVELAPETARISKETKLPMADSVMQEAYYEGIEGVEYVKKRIQRLAQT